MNFPPRRFLSWRCSWLLLSLCSIPAQSQSPSIAFCAHPSAKISAPNQKLPATGRLHALVLFGTFADDNATGSLAPAFSDSLFLPDLPGSLTHFFNEMSRGQYQLTGTTAPKMYRSRRNAATYLSATAGISGDFGTFVTEIVDAADEDIDFGAYDNDGPDGEPNSGDDDGFVDVLFVVVPKTPSGFLVSEANGVAALGLPTSLFTADLSERGGRILIRNDAQVGQATGGAIQEGRSFSSTVGIIAHELGHLLGLPDLFDTGFTGQISSSSQSDSGPADDSAGIGYWGLMGHGARGWNDLGGPVSFTPWSLARLGWLGAENDHLVVVDQTLTGLRIDDYGGGGFVYRIPLEQQSYLLVEHRRADGSYYDRRIPNDGLLIWQVNDSRGNNNNELSKLVDLVCADGRFADAGFPQGQQDAPVTGGDNLDFWAHDDAYRMAHSGNLGDGTDVFDGVRFTEFSPITNPASRGVAVEAIRRDGDAMVADLIIGDRRKAGLLTVNETWSGIIDVVADVEVPEKVRLRIAAGSTIRFFPDARPGGADLQRSELVVEGVLSVGGGAVTTFTSGAATPAAGDWAGITIRPLGEVLLQDVIIEFAVNALRVVDARRSTLIEDVEIRHVSGHAIHLDATQGAHTLTRVVVENAGATGLMLIGDAPMQVDQANVRLCGGPGLHREGGFFQCTDGVFQQNGQADGSGVSMLLGNDVFGTVTDNVFQGGTGIRIDEADQVRIEVNHFSQTQVAMIHHNSRAWISRNTIAASDTAFQIVGFTQPERFELNRVDATRVLVDNRTPFDVVAIRNWWGTADALSISSRMLGAVRFEPFLNFDPQSPVTFDIGPAFPNPSLGEVTIPYTVGIGDVSVGGESNLTVVEIHNVVGGFVRRLVDEIAVPGIYTVQWDGRDQTGQNAAAGLYYVELNVGGILLYSPLLRLR